MTQLLVSVRDLQEAREARSGGAHIIDVKEPDRGSLGAASADELIRIRHSSHQATLSAALGELVDEPPSELLSALAGYCFAKIGLARCGQIADWPVRWRSWMAQLPPGVRPVAVAYADSGRAESPAAEAILDVAIDSACGVLLVDTYDKSHGSLFEHLDERRLAGLIERARAAEMKVVLAGSLTAASIDLALSFGPDLIAVRGAACRGGRTGRVDSELVKSLVSQLCRSPAR